MPTPFAFRAVAVVAVCAFLAGCLAAVANAQDAVPQRTLVAVGTGTIKVTPKDAKDNASIVAAVKAANAKALPAAITDARTQATQLATAAGVTLGPLVSLSNNASPYSGGVFYGPVYPSTGSFGPGRFCGSLRTRPSTIGKDGKRHYGKVRTTRVCRVPTVVQRAVQLTFALG
ncbi:hypothetical protein DSM104299_00868 [Baekduia alba]|uniref:SIMPL domain-containing protein n=1 Tax=Baekduia alba TaxID=2997333 RepID=UPI00234182EA|nr:SIMPL domain-containing protein [Baekduia alba]WCB92179.1 hypothetical protein DSM104299_00868 [Baekduia alba]